MDFLTPEEVADRCRVTTQTVLNWIHSKQLPAAQLSPQVYRIPASAFERFLRRDEPVLPAVTVASGRWQEELGRYEQHFGLSTLEMLHLHAEGRHPDVHSPMDETLLGMWIGAAYIAVAAGLISASEQLPAGLA